MNRNARLGKLMDAYSEHTGTSGLRFVWRGEGVRRDDTAEEVSTVYTLSGWAAKVGVVRSLLTVE